MLGFFFDIGAGDVQVVELPDAIKTVLVRWSKVTKRFPKKMGLQIQNLHLQFIEANSTFFQEHCLPSDRKADANLDAKCEKILQVILDARKAANKLTKGSYKDGSIAIKEIEQELAQVLKGPYQFSRVIISGHHSPDLTRGLLSGELVEFLSKNNDTLKSQGRGQNDQFLGHF